MNQKIVIDGFNFFLFINDFFLYSWFFDFKKIKQIKIKKFLLHFGPQHPGSHGLIRLSLFMLGEQIKSSSLHIGLLHRGSEKIIENKIILKNIPYFDRMDYVATLTSEHAFIVSLEGLLNNFNKNRSALKIRTIFDEITRILNHLMHLSIITLDIGNFFIFFFFIMKETFYGFL